MGKRDWRGYPARFTEKASAAGTVVGLVGSVVAGGAFMLAAPVIAIASGSMATIGIAWAAVRAIPPKRQGPAALMGRRIYDFSELNNVYPRIRRIGFVGPTQAGKSTLVARLQAIPRATARTDNPYAVVIRLAGTDTYFALVDAAGHEFHQQFAVADHSDDLIIILDHAESDIDINKSSPRIRENDQFIQQLSAKASNNTLSLGRIHFLMNKRDLWESGPKSEEIRKWFEQKVASWPRSHVKTVSGSVHSNLLADDVTSVTQMLAAWTH